MDVGSDGGPVVLPAGDSGGISLLGDGQVTFGGEAGGYADATPDVVSDGACTAGDAGPPVYPQKCAPAAANECAGATDAYLTSSGISASMLNGDRSACPLQEPQVRRIVRRHPRHGGRLLQALS